MPSKPKQSNPGDINKVSQMDICQTPPHAIEPLLKYIPNDWVIWESACGPDQLLVTAFNSHGYTVIASDLLHGTEFNRFTYKPRGLNYDIEITNMPFSIKYKWLKQSFEDGKPFALLAPYETTFAKEFQLLFRQYNGSPHVIEILSPERRINFKMPNKGWGVNGNSSAQFPTVWITQGLNVHKKVDMDNILFTYYVSMRSVKYNNETNEEL